MRKYLNNAIEQNRLIRAGRIKGFIVETSKESLRKEAIMKWDIKKSAELKEKIANDESLMRELSDTVDKILKEYKIKLKGMSYVFEPRIFTVDADESLEIMVKSRAAMLTAIMEAIEEQVVGAEVESLIDSSRFVRRLPECGPLDPDTLRMLEKLRITEKSEWHEDSNPLPAHEAFIRQIVGNKDLLRKLSTGLFSILENKGFEFNKNVGCVFTPYVFDTPIFAQKVGVAEYLTQIRGFGPQVYAAPTPEPATAIRIRPFPGIIETPGPGQTVGVIVDRWWWIGIPAPEMLRALDVMREIGKR